MKKRIVSMILALSMVLSILPVSAFADAGTSAAAAETTAAGTNEETTNSVVTIKIGVKGLPEEQSGTGWSYDSSNNWLAIAGVPNAKTEYILDGDASCNVAISTSSYEVYLLDGVVDGQLWVGNPNACVLGGRYAKAVLENGTIDGGTYDKLTENGGSVTGGYFKDISGLQSATQQKAHKLILQDDCTLNGQPVTGDVYMLKQYSEHSLKLEVQYAPGCVKWAAAIGGMSDITSLPVGISNVSLDGCATVSISADGRTISAEVSMFPPLSESNAPIALTPIPSMDKELSFTGEGTPDVNGVPCVYSLDEGMDQFCKYYGKGWTYTCYPHVASATGQLKLGDQGGNEIDFGHLSAVPINCYVELSNAIVTGGIIRQANFRDVTIKDGTFDFLSCAGKCTISNVVAQSFEWYGGDLAISDTVLCNLSGNGIENALAVGQKLSTLTVRNGGVTAINGRDLPLSVNTIYLVGNASAELTLNTDVFSINGDTQLSNYNEKTYAEGSVLHITSNNDGKEILVNQAGDASNLKPLRITEEGKPDLTEVTPHSLNQDGVTGKVYEGLGWQYLVLSGEGQNGYVTMTGLILTSPDGSSPVDLTSDTINPYHKAIASDQIMLTDVTVTDIQADAPITARNATIQGGTFQKAVHADENSSITGGTFQESVQANGTIANGIFKKSVQAYGEITGGQFEAEVSLGYNGTITGGTFQKSVEAYGEITDGQFEADVTLGYNGTITGGTFQRNVKASGTITGGQFNAAVQLDGGNAQILGGVFNNIKLPDYYTSEGTVIRNAVITGSLMADTHSKAAVSNTVSFSPIESQHRAYGQQLSKLIVADGTDGTVVKSVNGVTKETKELYRIGDVEMNITFSKPVETINGAPANDYTGGQLSADGLTLTLTALNDGNPIVVNQTKGEKLPFSSLTEGDFTTDETPEGTKVTCYQEGVGKLRLVYVRTYDDKEFDSIPYGEPDNYGIYKKRVVAEEGEKYTSGSVDIGETVIKYTPALDDFEWDVETGTVKYNGEHYFGEEVPQAELRYYDEPNSYFSSVPTEVGTYEVRLAVNGNNYYNGNQDNDYQYPLVGQYTVRYTPVATDFTYDAAQNTVTYNGDKYNGADPQTTLLYGTDTDRSETVPTAPGSYNVYVQVTADENYNGTTTGKVGTYVVKGTTTPDPVPTTFALTVKNAQVTLKDGSDVADLTAVPAGTELKATAPEKAGYTFDSWEKEGLPADANIDGATITFKMPANNVTLKAKYTENAPETYELKVTDAQVTLKDGSAVADLTAVPAGTELVATAAEKDGYTFNGWTATGLPANAKIDGATVTFKMPANKVTLNAKYIANAPKTYELKVTNAKVTLKDGGAVADLTAVPVDTELVATAPEKDGYTFTGWEVTGLPADVDTTKATISFTMPANNVTLTPQYKKNTYTLTVNGKPEQRTFGEEVTLIARKPEGMTFSYWEIKKGLAADAVDVRSEKITFTMPANDVEISAIYNKVPTPDPDPETKTHKLNVLSAQIFLKDGSDVANLEAVPVGTELKAIAYEDTETEVFKCWTGLELTEEQSTARVVEFTMPDHDVNLVAEFVTPTKPDPAPETYKLIVSYAKITLKDGSAVADLKAVPAGTELKAIAYEDTETSVFKNWSCTGLELTEEQRTARVVEFTMPDHDVELTAVFKVPATPDPDPTPAPGGDGGGAAIVAVAAVGGAAIGVGAYIAGTTAYLKSVLPEGMAIPANRQQLAVALWTAAGKPATQSTALFNDVAADAAELQAIRWVVDTGLMTAQDGNFKPGSRVGRMEVIRTWKAYQQRG